MTSQQSGTLSIYKASKKLNVKPHTIKYNISKGYLPYSEVDGIIYIDENDLMVADLWISAAEAARLYGVTRERIRQLTKREGVLPYEEDGRFVYVNKKAVEDRRAKPLTTRRIYGQNPFGQEIARLRYDRGLTQSELSVKVSVSSSTISRIETGAIRRPGKFLVEKLAQELSPESSESLINYAETIRHRTVLLPRKKIGIVLDDFRTAYSRELLHELTFESERADFGIYLELGAWNGHAQLASIRRFAEFGVDGIILTSNRMGAEEFEALQYTVPLVVLERPLNVLKSYPYAGVVYPDVHSAYAKATEHLINGGSRVLWYLGDQPVYGTEEDRFAAITEVASRRNIEVMVSRPVDWDESTGYYYVRNRLSSRRPDEKIGVITFNDDLAHGVWKGFLDAGLRVPENVAIVGGYRRRDEDYFPHALSSVRIPPDEMAKKAFHMLYYLFQAVKSMPHASEFERESIVPSTFEIGMSTVGTVALSKIGMK